MYIHTFCQAFIIIVHIKTNVSAFCADLSASPLTVTSLGTNTENEAAGGLQEVEAEVHLSQQVRHH